MKTFSRTLLMSALFMSVAPVALASVDGINTDDPTLPLPIGAGGNPSLWVLPNGYLGVGYPDATTNSPVSYLDVAGSVISVNHKPTLQLPGNLLGTNNTNTAVGVDALNALATTATALITPNPNDTLANGSYNTAVGSYAGENLTPDSAAIDDSASFNTLVGYETGQYITTGFENTAIGKRAMNGMGGALTGASNTAVGAYALEPISGSSDWNTAVGQSALGELTGGWSNTAVGQEALGQMTGSGPDDALGRGAGYNVSTGANNVAIGYFTMSWGASPITGNGNTALGNAALEYLSGSASGNTAIGYLAGTAGTANETGTYNTFLGYETQVSADGYTNSTALGNGAVITGSNMIVLGNNQITKITANTQTISALSDRRRKKDIEDSDLGLAFVEKLRPVSYRLNNGDDTLRYGFIAQDLEQALPPALQDMVENARPEHGIAMLDRDSDSDRTYRLGYGELFAPLVKAMHEQEAKIDALQAEVATLKTKLAKN